MRHLAVITEKPQRSGCASIPDGAITGNGDLAVILGNSPQGLRIFLSKTDVWYAVEHEHKGGLLRVAYPEQAIVVTVNGNGMPLTAADLEQGIQTAPGDVIEIRTQETDG